MPNPGLRLKEPAIAGYAYNPPQTPPFEKEGLVVSLSAYLTAGENYPNRHSSLRRTINSAQIEKLRDRNYTHTYWRGPRLFYRRDAGLLTSSVIFCKMEKNLLLLCGVCVASERCVRYELLDLTYKYSH